MVYVDYIGMPYILYSYAQCYDGRIQDGCPEPRFEFGLIIIIIIFNDYYLFKILIPKLVLTIYRLFPVIR